MVITALHLGKKIPPGEVLIHGKIKDAIEPLKAIRDYGGDSLRYTLAFHSVPGMDTSFSQSRLKSSHTFANKIWNASRYVIMNLKGDENFDIYYPQLPDTDKWILHTLNNTISKLNDFIDNYRLNEAANLLYHFFRHEYCDWYLEFSKNDLHNPETRKTLKYTLYKLLQMLHPFMPFITEEIYRKIKDIGNHTLVQTEYPVFNSKLVFNHEFVAVEVLKKVISQTRKTRTENHIHPDHRICIYLKTGSPKEHAAILGNLKYFDSLTRSVRTEIVNEIGNLPKGYRSSCLNWEILLPLKNEEDRSKELNHLKKILEKIGNQVNQLEKKLSNQRFVNNASKTEVLNLKKSLQEIIDKQKKVQKTIDDLS
jgi:valyl-tRNA synthetase